MTDNNLNTKILSATKWSSVTEISAKLISPIVSMVLARVLTPEAFGAVATISMIVTFAEIFTDAGLQKYLIQHEFKDAADREESTTVAFWSNLILSLVIWALIIVFKDPLATMVGSPDLGNALAVACLGIPLAAFSSIQMALYKRDFDFKTLFYARLVGILIPLVVTVPLAFVTRNYWALVLGTLAVNISNAIILTVRSSWKPRFYYSFAKLKEMFSFSAWSMIEAVSIWMTSNIDIFIVSSLLGSMYLGMYKVSMNTVGQIMGIITSVTTPILFSSLSRLQNDRKGFESMFFKFQKSVAILVLPASVGIFIFSDIVVDILLGHQWDETKGFVGLWSLVSGITIVLNHYCSIMVPRNWTRS